MIADDELRELFETECEEHLQMLDDGLLRLETDPDDRATLEEVFRAAHSLKGTARMLGVSGVETIAHHMEEELGGVRRGRGVLSSTHIDLYSLGLAAIRRLVAEAVGGAAAGVDVSAVVAQLSGAPADDTASPPAADSSAGLPILHEVAPAVADGATMRVAEPPPAILLAQPTPPPPINPLLRTAPDPVFENESDMPRNSELAVISVSTDLVVQGETGNGSEMAVDVRREDFRIQTIRVPPAKLDALMTLASELTVTATRLVRGIAAFEELGALCEEWHKDLAAQRAPLRNAPGTESGHIAGGPAFKQRAAFHGRDVARLVRMETVLETLKQTTVQDLGRLHFVADELEGGIRAVRLLPLSQIFGLYSRLVRDLARELEKVVVFSVEGGETAADKRILEDIKDPLMHMLRNAVDHGIEDPDARERAGKPRAANIRLRAAQRGNSVIIELSDDGGGLDDQAIKQIALQRRLHSADELSAMTREQLHLLIFAPGFSTTRAVTDVSGRGVGMDVVRINVERLKGSIRVRSEAGAGTTFTISLPSTLATVRVLLVTVSGRAYAIPVEWVQTIVRVRPKQMFSVEGRRHILWEGRALPVCALSALLELETSRSWGDGDFFVVMTVGEDSFAVQVDGLVDEQEVILKPLGALLKRVRNVAGVTILEAGEVCMVLNAHDLARAALRPSSGRGTPMLAGGAVGAEAEPVRKVILLAEDSVTTRTQEKRILESAGYEVVTAVDGADAWHAMSGREFDAVVTDIEMPNMDGLTLAARIRELARYKDLPIVLVTSLASDDDRRRGLDVGANAYIAKGAFEQKVLLDTLRRLV